MIFICKLAVSLITPPGVFMLILFLLAILVICKSEHIVLGLALFLLSSIMYIISIPLVAFIFNNALNHIYSHQFPPKDANAAVIVLGGGWSIDEDGKPFQPSIETIERVYAAVKLSKEYSSCEFLIMSGGDTYERHQISVAEVMKGAAEVMDCKAKIIIEDKSRNTDENLKYSAKIVKRLRIKHVVIITSNIHMKRAMEFACQYMPDDTEIYAYPSGGYRKLGTLSLEMFLPSIRALSASCDGIKELIGGVIAKLSSR